MSENLARGRIWTITIAAAVVAIFVLYAVCFTVEAGTAGVVKRLGEITRVRTDPGIGWRMPWPLETVTPIDLRTRLLDVKGKEVLTRDKFNILATLAVGWRVEDPTTFVTRFANEEKAQEMLVSRVADARERVIKKTRLDEIISIDPKQRESFRAFEERIRKTLADGLADAQYGIVVDELRLRGIAFPSEVTQKVFDRMTNERRRVSEDLRTQGENLAAQIRQDAELKKKKILADAEAEARKIRGQGDAEAATHYAVFKENPELANFLRRCEAFREILKERSTVVLTPESEPFTLLQDEVPVPKSAKE